MNDKVKYWLEIAEYDFETALAMMNTKRFLYVGFMCHQTIEKVLKAYYSNIHQGTPPFTHSLTHLAVKCELDSILNENQIETIDLLEPLNIEARYPSQKDQLIKNLNEEKCIDLLQKTQELKQWIIQKL